MPKCSFLTMNYFNATAIFINDLNSYTQDGWEISHLAHVHGKSMIAVLKRENMKLRMMLFTRAKTINYVTYKANSKQDWKEVKKEVFNLGNV